MNDYKYRVELYYRCQFTTCYTIFNEYLSKAAKENLKDTILLVFHIRDIKNGLGLRTTGRHAFQWLMFNYPKEFINYIEYIPKFGRWDDLYSIFPRKDHEINKLWIYQNFKKIDDCIYLDILDCQQKAVMVFIEQLQQDYVNALNIQRISYAAKWALNEKSSLNRQYKLVTIMSKMWGISKRDYRKHIVFLRKYLNIPEHHICNNNFRHINYNQLPEYTISKYVKTFTKKDYRRFMEYKIFSEVKHNILKRKKLLYPFDIIIPYNMAFQSDLASTVDMEVERKWNELIETTTHNKKLNSTIIIGDISGSMYQQKYKNTYVTSKLPINISLSMMLLASRCVHSPYTNMIINVCDKIKYTHLRKNETLLESLYKLTSLKHSQKIDIFRLLNYILQTYIINTDFKNKKMVENVIFISDKTLRKSDPDFINNIDKIKKKYYENNLKFPKLIYINLECESMSFDYNNDILEICGFTYDIFKQLLSHGEINPKVIVDNIVKKIYYDNLSK